MMINPDLQDHFFHQYIEFHFGWRPSVYFFTKLMSPMIRKSRQMVWLDLAYIDDVLVVPRMWGSYGSREWNLASLRIQKLRDDLNMDIIPVKWSWEFCVQVTGHLWLIIDTFRIIIHVSEQKQNKIRFIETSLRLEAGCGRRRITVRTLRFLICTHKPLRMAVLLSR